MCTLFAYIDPFTGSLVLQLFAMAVVSVMMFFRKIKASVLGFWGIKKATELMEDTKDVPSVTLNTSATDNLEQQKKAA